uniref:Uncharacterized protein n=1 Tax=Populus trichocarpa TaxID=3694 RepID=A0A2K1XHH5_POPTR
MVHMISSNLVNFVYDRNLSIRQHSRLLVTCISFHYAVKVIFLFVEDISISIFFLSLSLFYSTFKWNKVIFSVEVPLWCMEILYSQQ